MLPLNASRRFSAGLTVSLGGSDSLLDDVSVGGVLGVLGVSTLGGLTLGVSTLGDVTLGVSTRGVVTLGVSARGVVVLGASVLGVTVLTAGVLRVSTRGVVSLTVVVLGVTTLGITTLGVPTLGASVLGVSARGISIRGAITVATLASDVRPTVVLSAVATTAARALSGVTLVATRSLDKSTAPPT
jgi:deleted-in-malignant-brain-tumors protein 1